MVLYCTVLLYEENTLPWLQKDYLYDDYSFELGENVNDRRRQQRSRRRRASGDLHDPEQSAAAGAAAVQRLCHLAACDRAGRQGGLDHRQRRPHREGYPKQAECKGGHSTASGRRHQPARQNNQV